MTLLAAPDDLVEGRLYAELLTAKQAADMLGRRPSTIRWWAHKEWIRAVDHDPATGAALYRRRELWDLERDARARLSPGRPRLTMTEIDDQFWAQVEGGDVTTCWHFRGHLNNMGYGVWRVHGKNVNAHRFAYTRLVGDIPTGLHLDHLCMAPSCVNPWHLDPVTPAVNNARARATKRIRARRHAA